MKTMTTIKAAFIAVFLCLTFAVSGCSTFETLGDYVNENPVFANIATRQAVGHYIAAGDTIEDERDRAEAVQVRVTKALLYLDGEPRATVDTLMAVIDRSIEWDELNPTDRLLIQDIMMLVEQEIRKFDQREPVLTDDTRLALRVILETVISTAQIYLDH